jgi:formylglycine-generating enzyme required for sulfatase activity
VLNEVEAFAFAHPAQRADVEARYLQLSALHGRTLGDAIAVSRHRAALEFEKLRTRRLAEVEKEAAAALAADDPARAAHVLFSFPEELRTEAQAKLWADALGPVLARVQESTGMAYVPAGEKHIGPAGDTRVVNAFLIDLCEVSNDDYFAFVSATGARVPGQWPAGRPSAEQSLLPVVGVNASEAQAYARWKGKRLPTSIEWEAAARGEESRHYPWGEEFDMGRCTSRGSPVMRLVGVRTLPGGRALSGAFHMAGNAAEWTADSVADPLRGSGRIVRGGSAKSHPSVCTTFATYAVDPGERDPELLIGFRCAQYLKQTGSTPSVPAVVPPADASAPATPEEPQDK